MTLWEYLASDDRSMQKIGKEIASQELEKDFQGTLSMFIEKKEQHNFPVNIREFFKQKLKGFYTSNLAKLNQGIYK